MVGGYGGTLTPCVDVLESLADGSSPERVPLFTAFRYQGEHSNRPMKPTADIVCQTGQQHACRDRQKTSQEYVSAI